jgi:hypothetical protein
MELLHCIVLLGTVALKELVVHMQREALVRVRARARRLASAEAHAANPASGVPVCSEPVGIDQLLELAGDVAHEASATDEMRARLGRAESAVCWAGLLLADLAHRPRAPRLGRRGVRRRLRVRHELDGAVWACQWRLQMRTGRQPSVCAEKTGQVLDPV